MSVQYQPIDCDYYDRLEAWATRKQFVTVTHQSEKEEVKTEGIIDDLYVRNHVEYMRLSGGEEVRLDTILCVNDGVDDYHLEGSCQVKQ